MTPFGAGVFEALLRGGALLLMALAAAALLRKRPASWRHAILMTALLGQGLLLVLALGAPTLRVRLLPAAWSSIGRGMPDAPPAHVPLVRTVVGAASAAASGGEPSRRNSTPRPAPAPDMGRLLTGVWLVGALALLARLGANTASLHRLRRDGCAPADPAWHALAAECAAAVGYRRPVAVLLGSAVGVPCVTGLRRPAVLLPATAVRWSAHRRRSVLLHELAHLARGVVVTTRIAQSIAAVCWPSPLVYLANRVAADARERAADDAVLRAGIRPSEYVLDLVGLLREMPQPHVSAVALGTQRSRTARRLRALLDPDRPRDGVRPRLLGLVVGAGACAVVPAALLAPPERAPRSQPSGVLPPAASMPRCGYTGGRHVDRVRRLDDGREQWQVEWEGESCTIAIVATGAPAHATTLAGLTPRTRADTVVVTATRGGLPRLRLVITGTSDLPAWWRLFTLELDRHTAFAYRERLAELAGRGGLDAVLTDVARMQGPHAAAIYLAHAVGDLRPSPHGLSRVLAAARTPVTSDAALGDVLAAVARSPQADLREPGSAVRAEYLRTAALLRARAARERAATDAVLPHP